MQSIDTVRTRRDAVARRREPSTRRFAVLRSLAMSDFITLANAGAGMAAILACSAYLVRGDAMLLWTAFLLFPVALVCDVLDGIVARARTASAYGRDLDSLADVISFGVAPAVLGYVTGMRGAWDAVVLVYFVMCGVSRLARFNVTADRLETASGKVSHFEGTPIPTSLVIVAALALAAHSDATLDDLWLGSVRIGPFDLHPFVMMYALVGSSMIATRLKVPKP